MIIEENQRNFSPEYKYFTTCTAPESPTHISHIPIFPYFPNSNTLIFPIFQYFHISHILHICNTCTAPESPTRISQEKDQQGSPRAPTLNKNTIQVHFAKYTQEKYTQENTLWKLKSWEKK